MSDAQFSRRDIFILVGLFILLVALVVVADMRASSYQEILVGANSATVVEGQQAGNGKGENGSAQVVRYNNTIEFIKIVALITLTFILFIAIITTMIILVIRILQRRVKKPPHILEKSDEV